MIKSVKKLYDFLENYILEEYEPQISKIIMNNERAIDDNAPSCIVKVSKKITMYTDKMNDADREVVLEIKKQTDEIEFLKNVLTGGIVDTFNEFDILSKYLVLFKMNSKDSFEIISYIINNSINDIENSKNNNNFAGFDSIRIVSFSKYNSLSMERRQIVKDCIEYTNISYEDLSEDEKSKKKIAMKYADVICISNPKEFINKLYEFKKVYLEKMDSFDSNDIKSIINILLYLGIDKEICDRISVLLEKDLNKRIKNDEVKVVPIKKTVKKSILMTDKEYRTIKKELRSYFDFYNVEKVRELNEEEIKKCIYLLLKIDTPIIEIQRFLRFFRLEYKDLVSKNVQLINDNNALVLYLDLFNKLKFYEKQLNISSNLKYIEECFMEMFICSNEDYEFYKMEIENELLKILNLLPQTFDYEIENIGKTIKLENKKF